MLHANTTISALWLSLTMHILHTSTCN